MSAPRIVLDARPLSHPQAGGFRTYVRALTRGLCERAAAGEPIPTLLYYVDRPLPADVAATLPPRSEVRVLDPRRIQTDLRRFPVQIRRDAPDLVHGTMNYLPLGLSAPTTVTIHDAMGIRRYPWDAATPRTPRERFINRYWAFLTRQAGKRARRVVTVSHGAKGDVVAALGIDAGRVRVVYNGVTLPAPQPGTVRDPSTLLAIESPDPRKNLALLYDLVREGQIQSGDTPPRLDVVCTGDVAAARATRALAGANGITCRLLTGLSDSDLSDTYARATVFVWPSRLEGFGMPPLEAMQAGCAVVSSSAPVMPEVLGDAPRYAPPDDPALWAAQIRALLCDAGERQERAIRGRALAGAFTPRRMADETVALWHEALA